MTAIDTSADAVERLSALMDIAAVEYRERSDCCGQHDSAGVCAAPACHFGNVMRGLQDGADALRALLAERDRMRDALRNLLEDTQHKHHNCGQDDCPVKVARALLGANHA